MGGDRLRGELISHRTAKENFPICAQISQNQYQSRVSQKPAWMAGWVDGWMEGWVDKWIDGVVDGWIHRWRIDEAINRGMDGTLVK